MRSGDDQQLVTAVTPRAATILADPERNGPAPAPPPPAQRGPQWPPGRQGWGWRGPLAGRYPAAALMVMLSLIPYLALSAALDPLTPIITAQLHMSAQTLSLSSGLGNAAYALGTVLAVQFAQLLPQRRMLVVYATLLVIGSVLAAGAQDPAMYLVGHTIQGLCTSLLLIAAVPPLALGFPADKFRDTAVIMSICIFGAVALGPLVGGVQASAHAWRPLFWVVAGIAVAALALVILTFDDAPPADVSAPRDPLVVLLAGAGCVAAFFGVSELTSHHFHDPIVLAPLLGGLAAIVALIVYQHRSAKALLTISEVLTSSIPVAGLIIALFAAAASVSASALTATALAKRYSPIHVGVLYVPELAGAVLTALALGHLIKRRELHFLPLAGMLSLAAGIAVFLVRVPSSQTLTLIGAALTGIGLGATVAPALFIAGMSLRAMSLQRVFAMVELLRAVAAFLIAPIFAYLALTAAGGTRLALWISLGLVVVGTLAGIAVYLLSGARPQVPDLTAFLDEGGSAWHSPPLLARARPGLRAAAVTSGASAGGVNGSSGGPAPAIAAPVGAVLTGAVRPDPAPTPPVPPAPDPIVSTPAPAPAGPAQVSEPRLAPQRSEPGADAGPAQETHELSVTLTVRLRRRG